MMTDEKSQRPIALVVTTLGSFLTPFMSSAINIALPPAQAHIAFSSIVYFFRRVSPGQSKMGGARVS